MPKDTSGSFTKGNNVKPSEYVAKVAEELQTNGWIQGEMHDIKGSSCLFGAMSTVVMREIEELAGSGVQQQVNGLMAAKLRERGFNGIPAFNDAHGRTLNEVLDFLHECQIGLKEREE
jgi:hypothetical protein